MTEPLTARDYHGFRALLNNRRMELRMSFEELDELALFPSRYAAKLLTSNYKKHNQQRNIGPESMGKLLSALGVEISIVPAKDGSHVLRGETGTYPQVKFLSKMARKGGLAAYAKMNSMQRRAFALAGAAASAKKRRANALERKKRPNG